MNLNDAIEIVVTRYPEKGRQWALAYIYKALDREEYPDFETLLLGVFNIVVHNE